MDNLTASALAQVMQRIRTACEKFDRDPGTVRLLAVSKTFGAQAIRDAIHAGQRDFGENYVQEAVTKITEMANETTSYDLQWHFIGPLQSNKSAQVAAHFDWVHSVDRLKIAQRLSAQRPAHLPDLQVCIQVNTDGGATKSGVTPDELPLLAKAVATLPRIKLRGLMAIPEPQSDATEMREVHSILYRLLQELKQGGMDLDTLSMGMSADLESAIAAGATMVRVGSAIFGSRPIKIESGQVAI